MKFCRWRLEGYINDSFIDRLIFCKFYRTLDEVIKVCTGFVESVDYRVYDVLSDDECPLDIDDYVFSQRDFEKTFYCKR